MQKQLIRLSSVVLLGTSLFGATLSQKTDNASLVVYNSNVGLVHEEKELSLKKEDKDIHYEGVASSINTDSININLPSTIKLLSQHYKYDKLTQAKLLEAHIGKKIEVRRLKNANEYQVISATLLSHNGSESIVKTIDYQILSVPSASIIFETIPKTLITKPSLVWNVETQKDIKTKLSLDYLINNITFKSDYILNLDKNSSNLVGWITINNHSGKSFEGTKLSLLAGDINRANQNMQDYRRAKEIQVLSSAPKVAHQAYEGYQFYTIPFKVTLADNEKTQIKFISKSKIPTQREFVAQLNNPLYLRGEIKGDITQYLSLNALDIPLPKGVVRTYSKLKGETILLGETEIDHTPKDTPIKLKLGKNFDLKSTQTLLKREDTKSWLACDVEYKVENKSDEAKEVQLLIPFNKQSNSTIKTDKNYSFTKGNFVTFSLLVAPNATEKFNVHFESKR